MFVIKVNKPTPAMKTHYLLLPFLLFTSHTGSAAPVQSLSAIQDALIGFVQSSLDPAGEYQITHTQIDPRLQLSACEQNLDVFVQSGEIRAGRNTLGVRCNGLNNWTIYSTVVVKSFIKVLVTTRQLNRNDKISPDYLATETRDISTLQHGYASDLSSVVNKQITRPVPAGSVLYSTYYAEPMLIKRGERVSIQSGKPGLVITSTGVAMMDGVKGQKISVKNVSSSRVIQGTVMNPGLVNVYF